MNEMYIMRGLPGSGKSTRAKALGHVGRIISADDYFMTPEGEYRFDALKLPYAHGRCFSEAIGYLGSIAKYNGDLVIDNTNTRNIEIAPYMLLAQAHGWTAKIIAIYPLWAIDCIKRNKHGVSVDQGLRMLATYAAELQQTPPWWTQILVEPAMEAL